MSLRTLTSRAQPLWALILRTRTLGADPTPRLPNLRQCFGRSLLPAALSFLIATSAMATDAAPANTPPSPPSPTVATLKAGNIEESASLAEAPQEASSYNFIVKPRAEPSGMQLLLGGLLAAIFIIRNRFRQR